ncbi:MAG: cellulase family glycosylhydrolase [Planctomycetota bacterium]
MMMTRRICLWGSILILFTAGRLSGDDRLPRIVVDATGQGFIEESRQTAFRPMGFNYDHDADGRLIEDYWHSEWDRVEDDFRNMKELGANTVRIHLQFGRFMMSPSEPREAELRQLEKLLTLAEKEQLYLDVTGLGCYHRDDVPEWYDALSEHDRWAAQAQFWRAVATVCRDRSAVFCYNLMNEPVIGGEQPAEGWLGPAFAGKHFVQFVARQTSGRSRHEIASQWIQSLVEAIRSVDQQHLITVGLVDWSLDRPGLTSGFDPEKVAGPLDFLAVHLYPRSGKIPDALDTLRGFQIGKPLIVEETFPLTCTIEEMTEFMSSPNAECDGWFSFFWGRMPGEYASGSSIADAVTSTWLTQFSDMMKNAVVTSPQDGSADLVDAFATTVEKSSDGKAPFSIDHNAWMSQHHELPIGVFDSGIGGLTVLEAVLTLDEFHNDTLAPGADGRFDFERERFIYFGDQGNMPYGNYPSAEKQTYLKELILKDATFLLGRRYWKSVDANSASFDKPPVNAIVIACNTATAWGLEEIRQLVDRWKIPVFVVGVVEAGARGVSERIGSDGHHHTVAVLATVGTCSSRAYPKAIQKSVGLAGRVQPTVLQQGSVGMAAAIEGDPAFVASGKGASIRVVPYQGPAVDHLTAPIRKDLMSAYRFDASGLIGDLTDPGSIRLNSPENYIRYDITMLVESYRTANGSQPIDTIVLGCTHFPLVQQEILRAFADLRRHEVNGNRPYEHLIADQIQVVDPARLTARDLFIQLSQRRMRANGSDGTIGSVAGRDWFYLSVANHRCASVQLDANGALTREYKYSRSPGSLDVEDTICVPMSRDLLPATSLSLIRTRLPQVWQRLSSTSSFE